MTDQLPLALREALDLPGPPWQRALVASCMAAALRWVIGPWEPGPWDELSGSPIERVIAVLEQEAHG